MAGKIGVHICVNCKENTDDDVALGGPKFLGFDFFVNPKYEIANYIKHIKKILQTNHIPVIDISANGQHMVSHLWSRSHINDCIIQEASNYQDCSYYDY